MDDKTWIIGLDADDTLWHNERHFRFTQDRFADLLRDHADPHHLSRRLLEAERRNLGRYGYGVKGFVLSMIETAIEVTEAKVPAPVIAELIAAGHEMLAHPVELLPGAAEALDALAPHARLVIITKGDLLDQERKIAQSGLGERVDRVEIVSEKSPATYARIFGAAPALMVGNSLRSDVIPALEAGAWGVHVPHALTFALEEADPPDGHPRFRQIDTLHALPALVRSLAPGGPGVTGAAEG